MKQRKLVARPIRKTVSKPEEIDQDGRAKFIQNLTSFFSIDSSWDAIIVSDGSATTWEHAAGWASVMLQKSVLEPYVDFGGCRRGTNNIAEIMAALWPIIYLAENGFGQREHGYRVHVISDSQYVVNGIKSLETGGTIWATGSSANRALWLAMLGCRRKGLIIRGHYIPRDTIEWNRVCHDAANIARRRLKDVAAVELTSLRARIDDGEA